MGWTQPYDWRLTILNTFINLANTFVNSGLSSALLQKKEITHTEFLTMVEEDKIHEIQFTTDRVNIITREDAEKSESARITYYTGILQNVDYTELVDTLREQNVLVSEEVIEEMSPIINILLS